MTSTVTVTFQKYRSSCSTWLMLSANQVRSQNTSRMQCTFLNPSVVKKRSYYLLPFCTGLRKEVITLPSIYMALQPRK
ncbi:hypothetical protein BJX64DRAFT_258460 [Aspergillus heterothallicus]